MNAGGRSGNRFVYLCGCDQASLRAWRYPSALCPMCHHDAPRLLDASMKVAAVIYDRCDHCARAWQIPKHDRDGPVVPVTDKTPTGG